MFERELDNLKNFQELIGYKFKNVDLLAQALTTPQFGRQHNLPDYNILETLGDAVLKLIFSLKLYKDGIKNPEKLTKKKAAIENDVTLTKIAMEYFNLEKFIIKQEKQEIKGTRILADVFEAICGAIFLDSEKDVSLIEMKIIDKFYRNLDKIIEKSTILNKNRLIEFLQDKYRETPSFKVKFINLGSDDKPESIAENPLILDSKSQKELVKIEKDLKSRKFKSKKDAEKDLYVKILEFLEKRS